VQQRDRTFSKPSSLNPHFAGHKLPAIQLYIARRVTTDMRSLANITLAKPRQSVEAISKIHELFIYEDINYFAKSFCKQRAKIAEPQYT